MCLRNENFFESEHVNPKAMFLNCSRYLISGSLKGFNSIPNFSKSSSKNWIKIKFIYVFGTIKIKYFYQLLILFRFCWEILP